MGKETVYQEHPEITKLRQENEKLRKAIKELQDKERQRDKSWKPKNEVTE